MKKILLAITGFALLFFCLCARSASAAPSVVATIFPQYDFLRNIGGERIELTMLIKPGAESHSYEPSPQEMIRIRGCDLFVYVGGESEAWVERVLEATGGKQMKTLSLMETVETVEEEIVPGMDDGHDHHDETGGHDHAHKHGYDEHVWTSPRNAVKIVRALEHALCGIDPDGEALYRANAEAYVAKLEALDAAFRDIVRQGKRSLLVFGDRFPLRYFTEAYDLRYRAAFPGCAEQTEASAATIAYLIRQVEDEKIPVIFHIELSNEKTADIICESTGAKKRLFHSCHNLSRDDFAQGLGYLELMSRNAENLREALR